MKNILKHIASAVLCAALIATLALSVTATKSPLWDFEITPHSNKNAASEDGHVVDMPPFDQKELEDHPTDTEYGDATAEDIFLFYYEDSLVEKCGDFVVWERYRDGMSIMGKGKTYDFYDEPAPWADSAVFVKSVEITHGITYLGANLFAGFNALEEVIIPDTVTEISDEAFAGCDIDSVTIYCYSGSVAEKFAVKNGIAYVCDEKYANSGSFDDITWELSDGVLTVTGKGSVKDLVNVDPEKVEEIVIGDGIVKIDEEVFSSFKKLKKLTLSDSVKKIADYAFYSCGDLNEIIFSKELEWIGEMAFASCPSLESVRLGANIRWIGNKAFAYSDGIVEFVIPSTMMWLGEDVFHLHGDELVIFCPEGSSAQEYAKEHMITSKMLAPDVLVVTDDNSQGKKTENPTVVTVVLCVLCAVVMIFAVVAVTKKGKNKKLPELLPEEPTKMYPESAPADPCVLPRQEEAKKSDETDPEFYEFDD